MRLTEDLGRGGCSVAAVGADKRTGRSARPSWRAPALLSPTSTLALRAGTFTTPVERE